ncbi:MAG: ATP-binding protein [Prevotellaceae bacterium]|jgi:predicted HTH transcriptional regulator|nr:ATP-binding protein [Prevotellaceae bacterium]
MNALELLDIINSGETSRVQFKQEMDDDKFAVEMIAMSNAKGGIILVGVEDKTGKITGLAYEQLQSYNNRLANVANEVKPQIFIETEVVILNTDEGEKRILIVTVSEGISKPYKDKNGAIWTK